MKVHRLRQPGRLEQSPPLGGQVKCPDVVEGETLAVEAAGDGDFGLSGKCLVLDARKAKPGGRNARRWSQRIGSGGDLSPCGGFDMESWHRIEFKCLVDGAAAEQVDVLTVIDYLVTKASFGIIGIVERALAEALPHFGAEVESSVEIEKVNI